jgi:hypothetical protein
MSQNEGLEIRQHLRIHGPAEFTRAKNQDGKKTETEVMTTGDRDWTDHKPLATGGRMDRAGKNPVVPKMKTFDEDLVAGKSTENQNRGQV